MLLSKFLYLLLYVRLRWPSMSGKKPLLLHPFLFAIAPIIFLFSHNINELSLFDQSSIIRLVLPCAFSLGLAWALLFGLHRFVFENRLQAGALVSLLLFLFFGFGHIQSIYLHIVEQSGGDFRYVLKGIKIGHYKFFFACWIGGGLLLIWLLNRWLRKSHSNLPGLTVYLNRVAAVLIIIAATTIGWTEINRVLHPTDKRNSEEFQAARVNGRITSLPDIYYIILDSYAAADTLCNSYGYDNQEFLGFLSHKGFYLASKSCSNYTSSISTVMSLASSLNFEYLNFLSATPGRESANISLPVRMVENSKIMRFLKANGYTFINFKTPIGPAARNRHADWDMDCNRSFIADDFLRLLIETTLLEPFFRVYNTESRRERILCQFAALPHLFDNPNIRRPIFVFAHILCPHWPYIFGQNGQPISEGGNRGVSSKELSINQLIFINKLVKKMLDTLLADPNSRPIIILQGDHGPLDHPGKTMEETFRSRMRILNAYLLPNDGKAKLYDSISPVNTFRVILNHYFGTIYPLLKDRAFYSNPDDKNHYELKDVTDIVKYGR
jgi:hypothetical protein